jgi:hypothetical protein
VLPRTHPATSSSTGTNSSNQAKACRHGHVDCWNTKTPPIIYGTWRLLVRAMPRCQRANGSPDWNRQTMTRDLQKRNTSFIISDRRPADARHKLLRTRYDLDPNPTLRYDLVDSGTGVRVCVRACIFGGRSVDIGGVLASACATGTCRPCHLITLVHRT